MPVSLRRRSPKGRACYMQVNRSKTMLLLSFVQNMYIGLDKAYFFAVSLSVAFLIG